MSAFIGIDPGKGGGLAAIDSIGAVLSTVRMPDTDTDLLRWLQATWPSDGYRRAVIELLRPMPPSFRGGSIANFQLGKSCGRLLMALAAAGIPFVEVTPVKWQTALQCRTGGDKNITKRRAAELFPGVKVTHAISDALLLAEFCRRMERR